MKPTRLNLCTAVRCSLVATGYSTVKVVQSVNAALNDIEPDSVTATTGDGKANMSKGTYMVTVAESHKYKAKLNVPLMFDAWHGAITKAEKIAPFESVEIPSMFKAWLDKFAKATDKDAAQELTSP